MNAAPVLGPTASPSTEASLAAASAAPSTDPSPSWARTQTELMGPLRAQVEAMRTALMPSDLGQLVTTGDAPMNQDLETVMMMVNQLATMAPHVRGILHFYHSLHRQLRSTGMIIAEDLDPNTWHASMRRSDASERERSPRRRESAKTDRTMLKR